MNRVKLYPEDPHGLRRRPGCPGKANVRNSASTGTFCGTGSLDLRFVSTAIPAVPTGGDHRSPLLLTIIIREIKPEHLARGGKPALDNRRLGLFAVGNGYRQ